MIKNTAFISFLRSKSRALMIPALLGSSLSLMPAPALGAEKAANVYGYLGYFAAEGENDFRAGWYKINTEDGSVENIWLDMLFGIFGTYFNVGYTRDNMLCGYYGNASQFFYMEFDLATGNTITQRDINVEGDNAYRYIRSGAYNRVEDCLYGFSSNIDGTKEYMVKAHSSDPDNFIIVREVPENFLIPVSCCFNPKDDHIYGIDQLGDLIRVDVHGNFEWIGEFSAMSGETSPNIAGWESAMIYSPRDNAFIWNRQASNYDSWLYKIDADTYKWSKLRDLDWADQYTIMDCTDTDGDEDGPVAPTLVRKDFVDSSLSGNLVFKMPEKLANGQDAPTSMKWTVTDGADIRTGVASPGEEVTVNYSDIANGEHNFTAYAEADGLKGASMVCNTWIGFDTPLPPANIVLTPVSDGDFSLTWEAPKGGAHASYVNFSNLRYTVYLDGKVVTGPLSECNAIVKLPVDAETQRYSFQVEASADGMTSERGRSNYVFTGRGYNLPINIVPTQEQADNMTRINVDNDKSSWAYMLEIGRKTPAFYSGKDWDNKGNDWLITPPLWMDNASAKYKVAFEVKYHNPLRAEEFYEVWLGTAPTEDDIRTIRIAPKTRVNDNMYYEASFDFEVPAAGTYYLGIRYVGDADQGGIYVRNINITNGGAGITETGNAGVSVRGTDGSIMINSPETLPAVVYATDGRCISAVTVEGECSVSVESGIYLVRIKGATYKVYVK